MATEKNFEEQLGELEDIVKKLESDSVSLDETLALFEQGVKLAKSCQKTLETAERQVKVLMSDGSEKDFEHGNDGV